MAGRIIWSIKAKDERRLILEYWHKRNGNKNFSKKLAKEFRETVKYIATHNYLGRATDAENIRVTVCGHYLLFYEIRKEVLEIIAVWDNRRKPSEKQCFKE